MMAEMEAMGTRTKRIIGRNPFQVRAINRSYRIRGYEARTQINKNAMRNAFRVIKRGEISGSSEEYGRKKIDVRRLMIRILAYSAMKISANGPALYSVLNPETSSDSPSAKSKGVRFVSAKVVVNHVMDRGISNRSGAEKL